MLKALAVALAAALLALAFALIGDEVAEGDTRRFDMQLLRHAQALREAHPGLAGVMRDFSGLGSTAVLALVTVLTVAYLLLVAQRRSAALVTVSVICGSALVVVFKSAFARWRPDASMADFSVSGLSFPSGHASMSAIVFLTIGTLIAASRRRKAERAFILSAALLMTLLVGVSRAVLGVHWATDVIGGWAFGTAWALAWLLLVRLGASGRGVEPAQPGPRGGAP
jgi:undecaprenyl-diphosphatase